MPPQRIKWRNNRFFFAVFLVLVVFPAIAFVPKTLRKNSIDARDTTVSFTRLEYKTSPPSKSSTSSSSQRKTSIRRKHWDEMVPRLRDFQKKHGHARVTQEHEDPELYEWVRNIRYNYIYQVRNITDASNKRKRLSEKKLQILTELDFCWETKRKWKRWGIVVERLKQYKNDHGHTHVTKSDGDAELYEWTKYIRYNYRHQALGHKTNNKTYRPRLSSAKMKILQEVGFHWETKRRINRWSDMLPRLKAFKEKHGHTLVQASDDLELYQWTHNLIRNYGPQLLNETQTRKTLSKEKLETLQSMGFSWETRSSMWDRRYQQLREFQKNHGHCHVPARKYPQLGVFVQNQRQEFRRYLAGNYTALTKERIDLLQLIKFEWARSQELTWEERRGDLEEYWQKVGNSDVPQDYAKNVQLGQWAMNQRTLYRLRNSGEQTGLTSERVQKLEVVDFKWKYREERWYVMLNRLKQYQEENGHLEIEGSDTENSDLRQWLNEQRYYYRNEYTSRLPQERIEALEEIPYFSWRRRGKGPSKADWSDLFVAIKEKGIAPGGKAKEHWFDGVNPFDKEIKTQWTEQELVALWNEENGDDEDEGEDNYDDDDDDEGEYFEDEESRLFLRA